MSKPELSLFKYHRHTDATACRRRAGTPLDGQLRAFLAGDSDGSDLLRALYSPILDEPVPERLRALVRR